MARTHPWEVSDELWKRVEPLVPPPPSHAKGGRPRLPARQVFAAIVYVLRTGIQWNALPRELGASSTVHARFQAWERAGFFRAVWEAQLQEFDELIGIAWEWQALDGAMTKAPFGGAASGPNPTDRAKRGVKRSLLTDGAGIPLAVAIDGANRHDMKLVTATLDSLIVTRPARPRPSISVWTPGTTTPRCGPRRRRADTTPTFVVGARSAWRRRGRRDGERGAGWWSGPMPG